MANRLSRRRFLKQSSLATGAAASLPLLPSFIRGPEAQSPATTKRSRSISGGASGRAVNDSLSRATLLLDGPTLRLRTEDPADSSVAIFPAPAGLTEGHGAVPAKDEGLFRRFSPRPVSTTPLRAVVEAIQPAGSLRTIPIAPSVPSRKQGMAMQPEDADFAQAAVWRGQTARRHRRHLRPPSPRALHRRRTPRVTTVTRCLTTTSTTRAPSRLACAVMGPPSTRTVSYSKFCPCAKTRPSISPTARS
jgi:hypothetical protein